MLYCMDSAAAADLMHVMRVSCGCNACNVHMEFGIWNGNGFEWNGTGCDVMYIPVFAKKTVFRDVGCTLVAQSPCHPSVQCCREARTEPFAKNIVFFASPHTPRPCTNIELRVCKGSVQPMCTQHREALFFSQTPVVEIHVQPDPASCMSSFRLVHANSQQLHLV